MTAAERMSLSDDLSSAAIELEKARFIQQEIQSYFDTDEKSNEGTFAIRFNFHRYAVFCDLLGDVLAGLAAILPSSEWVDDLQVEEEVTKA